MVLVYSAITVLFNFEGARKLISKTTVLTEVMAMGSCSNYTCIARLKKIDGLRNEDSKVAVSFQLAQSPVGQRSM